MSTEDSVPTFGHALFFEQARGSWEYPVMYAMIDDVLEERADLTLRAYALLRHNSSFVCGLLALPEVDRLVDISQAGWKRKNGKPVRRDYSRYHHSVSVAVTVLCFAVILELPDNICLAMFALGLWHDVGHFALSHDLEPVIAKRLGYNHEERTEWLFDRSEELKKLLREAGAYDVFCMVMRGQGSFHRLLELADTVTYLRDDPVSLGLKRKFPKIVREVGETLLDTHEWGFTVREPRVIEHMLGVRAWLYRNLYCSETNLLLRAAINELACLRSGEDPSFWQRCVAGRDDDAVLELSEFARRRSGWPAVLLDLLQGRVDESQLFCFERFQTYAELNSFRDNQARGLRTLVVEPKDFRKKVIQVRCPGSVAKRRLCANRHYLRERHIRFSLYVYVRR